MFVGMVGNTAAEPEEGDDTSLPLASFGGK
jgi:hypothetical protein